MMMQNSQRIIVSGSDSELTGLIDPLQQKGAEVLHCPDGSRTLEQALTWAPALVVLDTASGPIPPRKLFQILRANPRTADIAFCFIGREGEKIDGFRLHRDMFIDRPYNREQLLGRIFAYLTRREKAAQVSRRESDIEGKLEQVPLVDLLQIFTVNRKDGILHLDDEDTRGEIHVSGGKIVNAKVGGVEGEKAFYRLLTWSRGQFWFVPQGLETEMKIAAPSEHLIMEGLRQADELAALRDSLPGPEESVRLNVGVDELPRGLRPATQEVLVTLQYFRRIGDVLDNCRQSDLEIWQVLRVLLAKGIICRQRTASATAEQIEEPLLDSAEILAIKERLGDREGMLEEASVKMILLSDSAEQMNSFVQRLAGIREFSLDEALSGQKGPVLGDVGSLTIGDMLSLRLVAMPAGSG
ncbi:MAG: response regulator, partial [Desulfuromonadales bacterium]|nr:response regulator [Desulfuromonadales bacterium]NIR33632.1 response regulator [Desulfuromonadales bacterium]NIS41252.1 response regulator [Desulfuromonadales bacterium]